MERGELTAQILVYDDEPEISEQWSQNLEKIPLVSDSFEVVSINNNDFKKEVKILNDRRMLSRKGKIPDYNSLIDNASILILDYDLVAAHDDLSFLTGEIIAYMARCFSHCGLIIGINQYGRNDFDLTLRQHPESYCDLNLGGEQFTNIGLWSEKRMGFRPWCWPELPSYLQTFNYRIQACLRHLEDPILETLGLNDPVILSKSIAQFIGTNPESASFKEFATSSGRGLGPKDASVDPQSLARIAVAGVSKWLEQVVLPGQDILIDAPHLVSRFPSLLGGEKENVKTWNQTARFVEYKDLPLDFKKLENYRFKKDFWLSRPAWFWQGITESEDIDEVLNPMKKEEFDFLFCEDSSTFENRKICRVFKADVDSPYTRRFIHAEMFKDVNYTPKIRLLT